jgi:hypothetical protein
MAETLHLRPRLELLAWLERRFERALAAARSDAWLRQYGWRMPREREAARRD